MAGELHRSIKLTLDVETCHMNSKTSYKQSSQDRNIQGNNSPVPIVLFDGVLLFQILFSKASVFLA
jgi:hypothetical protein